MANSSAVDPDGAMIVNWYFFTEIFKFVAIDIWTVMNFSDNEPQSVSYAPIQSFQV